MRLEIGEGMAVDRLWDEDEIVDELKAGTKLCDEVVVDAVRVDIGPDEVADEVQVAAVDEVRGDVTPTDEVKNDVVPIEGVVDDIQVVAVDAVLDVVVVVDVVLGNDVVVDVVWDDEIVVDGVLDDEVVVEVDEMVTNGAAVVGLDIEFVVAVATRKKKRGQ